jgi:hypothetical protein
MCFILFLGLRGHVGLLWKKELRTEGIETPYRRGNRNYHLKEGDPWDVPEQDVSVRYKKTSRGEESAGRKSKGFLVGREKIFAAFGQYKTERCQRKQTGEQCLIVCITLRFL